MTPISHPGPSLFKLMLLLAVLIMTGCGELITEADSLAGPPADRSTLTVNGNPQEVVVNARWSVRPEASCEGNRNNRISLKLTAGPHWPETEQDPAYDLYVNISFFFGGEQPPAMPIDIHSYESRCVGYGGTVSFYNEAVPAGPGSRLVGGELYVDIEGAEEDLTFHARFVDLEIRSKDGSSVTVLDWDHTGPMGFSRTYY